ncbi:hypothetical protein E3N88_03599 [Mikania micrantha]|uniref:Integrase catalytic domain-containing protein n=1 Tax=Mikania micrantha TaxID=192012 RepID=A0A5N6Q7E2_9ASTR|nr:hypothetical protein E3N88_03599 [Mikania micrantha]
MGERPNEGAMVATKESTPATLQCPILNVNNYNIWAIRLKAVFKVHGILEAIEPGVGTVVNAKKDDMAVALLYQAIPEELVLQVSQCKTSKEIWDSLKLRFVGADRVREARLQTLQSELESLKMNDTEGIDDFANKLSQLVSKANSLGSTFDDKTLVRKLLGSVPERFLAIVASIEQFADLNTMTFQEAIGRLKAFEERTKAKSSGPKTEQLMLTFDDWQARRKTEQGQGSGRGSGRQNTRGRGRGRGFGGRGRGQEHQGQFQSKKDKDKTKIKCFVCEKMGHYASECPLKPRQEESNLTEAREEGPALMMTVAVFLNEERVHPNQFEATEAGSWFLDNGASNHMTRNRGMFANLDRNITGRVRFGDGSCVNIEGKGSIILECKNGDQRILSDVYYIPTLKSNIISLGQLTEINYEIKMKKEHLWVYEESGAVLMKVSRTTNRLYKINLQVVQPACLHVNLDNQAWLWHARLGHLNFESIKDLTRRNLARGLPSITHPSQVCEFCLAGKQVRLPFPSKSGYRSSKSLELIYADVCGPISPTTHGGNRFLLLIVDDYSRYMWGYLIKAKSEVYECLKDFKSSIEQETSKKIKGLRTDNGGEFNSQKIKDLCAQSGICHQLTAPYSPQQNGVVERRNRTIIGMTRSLLKAMSLPQNFWGEGVLHAIYILNRSPTKALNNQTPYEAFKGRKPNIQHIRVFGCVGYVKVLTTDQRKLDDRCTKMVHLGTQPKTKAYRMFDPETGRIHVSRDVQFDETKAWNWEKDSETTEPRPKNFVIQDEQEVSYETRPNSPPQLESNRERREETEPESEPESPESTVKGRGPILPREPNDKDGPHDPSMAPEEGYDHTPIRGFKELGKVYNASENFHLLLSHDNVKDYQEKEIKGQIFLKLIVF